MSAEERCPNCERSSRRIAELEGLVERLQRRIEDLERAGKRQAAPFSKGPPKENPKTPGQKPGHEAFFRRVPNPEEVTRREKAFLPSGAKCSDCGGRLGLRRWERQFQYDLPRITPVVTQFDIEVCECLSCGKRVQGRHPDQASDALGKAAVQIGPRAIAVAVDLKYRAGMPWAKIRSFLEVVLGFRAERSTLVRAAHRVAERFRMTYEALLAKLRRARRVHGDETGWRVNGRSAWLWDFASPTVSLYTVDASRGADVPTRILGEEFRGRLHCDGARAYQPLPFNQQTCQRHIDKDLRLLAETQPTRGRVFPKACLKTLKASRALHRKRRRLSPHGFRVARGRIEVRMDRLLGMDGAGGRRFSNAANQRMANRLFRHHVQGDLFAFLHDRSAEPTNNHAERELRPGVVFRKISAGNRSWKGAKTFEILTSVLRTAFRMGVNTIEVLVEAIRCRDPAVHLPIPQPSG